MTLKCVMFDFGGTLMEFVHKKESREAYYRLLKQRGYRFSRSKIEAVRREEILNHLKENYGVTKKLHAHHRIMGRVFKRLGVKVSERELHEIAHEFEREMQKHHRVFPGVRRVLSSARRRGLKTALVCNGSTEWTYKMLERYSLEKYFDVIVISEEVGKEKSSLLPFRVVLKKLRLRGEECLMIGDRLDEDMYAKKLGIWTCHAAYGATLPPVEAPMKPDFSVKSISGLLPIVDRLSE